VCVCACVCVCVCVFVCVCVCVCCVRASCIFSSQMLVYRLQLVCVIALPRFPQKTPTHLGSDSLYRLIHIPEGLGDTSNLAIFPSCTLWILSAYSQPRCFPIPPNAVCQRRQKHTENKPTARQHTQCKRTASSQACSSPLPKESCVSSVSTRPEVYV